MPRMTENDKKRVLELHETGMSNLATSREVGFSHTAIAKFLKRNQAEKVKVSTKVSEVSTPSPSTPIQRAARPQSHHGKPKCLRMTIGYLKTLYNVSYQDMDQL